jgi:lipoate---protein ligase
MKVYMPDMLCINNLNTDPYFNLASEEYLIKNFSDDVFMLWQNEQSIIIGKHQDVKTEVNLDFANDKQIKVARRFSGGGAVYNDLGNVNLTFIETVAQPDFSKYTRLMLDFLSSIGIDARADDRRGLFVDGLKISGSAQYIYKNKVLYHASLLVSANLNYLNSTLDSPLFMKESDEPWRQVKSVKSPVANLNTYLPGKGTIEIIKNQIISYFFNTHENMKLYELSGFDREMINHLKDEKYSTRKWNYHAELVRKKITI